MVKFSTDLLKTKLSLVNWQYGLTKWALVALCVSVWTWHWYDKGKVSCQREAEGAALAQIVEDVRGRLPVVQQAERDAAELRQELKTMKEKLDEEADKPVAVDCSLSDSELQLYREAAQKTKR